MKKFDIALIRNQANVRALTGIDCDNAWLVSEYPLCRGSKGKTLYTDFRYIPMAHRVAPKLKVRDISKFALKGRTIGYESTLTVAEFERIKKFAPRAKFVDIVRDLAEIRAVKTEDEIAAIRRAVKLNDDIWERAARKFKAGMSEITMARIIKRMMLEEGEGEAFETIVCVGANAAECHHVPDGTKWNGRDPVLVDMGVKLGGFCSDMTRNLVKGRVSTAYRRAYEFVLKANEAAIKALKPGMTGKALDKVAREVIRKGGFGKCFGHSLGHGVGLEIHEAPYASKKSDWILKPGMLVTIEPGIYLEGNLGIRIEDLVLVTKDGCEVLTRSAKKL